MVVYLLPNTPPNQKIIKSSSRYELFCSEETLKTARGYRVTTSDANGEFFFNNISTGKYLIKICTYYGGYYNINIKTAFKGTVTLPAFEADPPIR